MARIISMTLFALLFCFGAMSVTAGEPVVKTIEALYKEKAELKGQQVQLKGTVVKVNNHIMKRNFIHIQDGTGENKTSDLTITSQDTAKVGDKITVVGTVAVDHDFGGGYMYPLMLEKATISKETK